MGPPETKRDAAAEGLGRAIAERQESNSFALLLEVGLLRFYPRALQQGGHNPPSPDSFLAPQGLAQGCRGKHQVEAHAHAALAARVGVDGVLQIRREDEQRAVLDLYRSEEHTSELQSPCNLVCRLLLEKKKKEEYMEVRQLVTING